MYIRDEKGNIYTDVLGKKWWVDNLLMENFEFIKPKVSHKIAHRRSDMFIVVDGPVGSGKCQPANSKVMMANGEWKNIQDIKIGDEVLSPQKDGSIKISKVLDTTSWFCDDVYNIVSANKRKKLYSCSYNHPVPMYYRDGGSKEWRIEHMVPKDIIGTGKYFIKNNMAITCPPIQEFKGRENCIIEPYTLGAMLGDGYLGTKEGKVKKSRGLDITANEIEIIKEIEKTYAIMSVVVSRKCAPRYRFSRYNYYTKIKALALYDELKSYGLIGKHSGDKFIPKDALYSDINYRKRLLAGLIDTDGYKAHDRSYEYVSKSIQLIEDVKFLVHSLGGRCGEIKPITKKIKSSGFSGNYYMLSFNFPYDIDLPIQVTRKKNKFIEDGNRKSNRAGVHTLRSEKTDSCMVYGFELDGDSHWYITDNWMITHNTTLSFQCAKYFDPTFNLSRVVFSVEDFLKVLVNASPGQAVVFDEAIIVNSRSALTDFNKKVIVAMTQIRSKGLYLFFNLPSVFDLDRNLVLNRCQLLLHCYQDVFGDRGKYMVFDKEKLKMLYLKGKKLYSYNFPRSNFVARFTEYFYLDRIEYEKKKQTEIAKAAEGKKSMTVKDNFHNLMRRMYFKPIGNWDAMKQKEKLQFFVENIPGSTTNEIHTILYNEIERQRNKRHDVLVQRAEESSSFKGII